MSSESASLKNYGLKRILVIDDDQDLQTNFREIFEMEDYHVTTAKNGQDAIDILNAAKDNELPDVILLDYNMPIMNGAEFSKFKQATPRYSQIPVILMTANGELYKVMNNMEASAFLDKPLTVDQLLRVTFNFIHRAHNSKYSFIT